MRARADVGVVLRGGEVAGRVFQEAQVRAGGAARAEVHRGEEVGRGDAEPEAEEGGEFEGEVVAEVAEGADEGLVGGDGWRDGLLGLVVEEFAEVEGSVEKGEGMSVWAVRRRGLRGEG